MDLVDVQLPRERLLNMTEFEGTPPTSEFLASHLCFDHVLYPRGFSTKERLEKIKTFPVRQDDVFVSSYPSSGSHWTMKIVFLILHNGEDEYMSYTPIRSKDYYWLGSDKLDANDGDQESTVYDAPGPRVIMSHAYYNKASGGPPNTTSAKYIYCARNPKDVAVSYYHHYNNKKLDLGANVNFDLSFEQYIDHFLEGRVTFGSWWNHVPVWWAHRHESNVLFLKYEEMSKDLVTSVRAISDFLGHKLDPQTIEKIAEACSIHSKKFDRASWSKNKPIRKGIVGDWKNFLTPTQSSAIDERYKEAVKGTDLEFDFDGL